MRMSRRQFISASSAFALSAAFGTAARAAPVPRSADAVVIGAGAAGIAAARALIAAKRSVIVLEASDRIGGRCITDTGTFSVPFDRGARWLHNPDSNSLNKLARASGIELYTTPPGQRVRIGRRNAREAETELLLASVMRSNRALSEAMRRGDIAAAAAMPKDLATWNDTVRYILGAYATGMDLEEVAISDVLRHGERMNYVAVRPGIGTLMQRLADQLPIATGTPATRVQWGGREMSVETSKGRIATRAVIVTASLNALSSGALAFAPALPKRHQDALAKLKLGHCERIALEFDGDALGLPRNEMIIEKSANRRTGLLLANIDGSTLCTVDVAGSFGLELAKQGDAAMVAFAKEWLGQLYGSEIADKVKRTATTHWHAEKTIGGAFSAALPGGGAARATLAEPMAGLFLAGEATHEALSGTVDGAWESGLRAAEAAIRRLGPVREQAQPRRSRKSQN